MRIFSFLLLKLCILFSMSVDAAEPKSTLDLMQSDGYVLMLRHALAPGFGDPENISIGHCTTQRNLNQTGRDQAKNIGKWLTTNTIKPSAIYTSQWCRCKETAELLDVGKVKELTGLNSFYQMPENRSANLHALRQFLSTQATNQKLIIMVTHSVTISAISGQSVSSGDGVLLKLNDSNGYDFVTTVDTNSLP